jgi:transcriptional regulator with XRE-family HTH domain
MRVTARDLGTARASWGRAIRAGLLAKQLTLTAASEQLSVSRQYLDRLLSNETPTIPIERFNDLCEMAGVDPAQHFRPNTEIPTWPPPPNSPTPT